MKNSIFKRVVSNLILTIIVVVIVLGFAGCSELTNTPEPTKIKTETNEENVKWVTDYSVQYEYNKLVFLFAFKNSELERISASANVDINIKNANNTVVYEISTSVSENDFTYWTKDDKDLLMASVDIPLNQINPDVVQNGLLTVKIYNNEYFSFESVEIMVSNLPIKSATLKTERLPITLKEYYIDKYSLARYLDTRILITEITYQYTGTDMYITMKGIVDEKVYYPSKIDLLIEWKLYDKDNYHIEKGIIHLTDLYKDDKFIISDIVILNKIVPGDEYRLELSVKEQN